MAELTNFDGSMTFEMEYDDPAQMARMLNLIQGVDSKIGRPKKSTKSNAWMRQNGFYKSKGEFGIKVLDDDRFAVLYIPKGAVVHVDFAQSSNFRSMFGYGFAANSSIRFIPEEKTLRKHRADEAYVVALCKLVYEQREGKVDHGWTESYIYHDEKLSLEIVHDGKSCKDKNFEYHTGAKLVIGDYDYDHDEACSQGIHFFTNIQQTLDYAYVFSGWSRVSKDTMRKHLMFTMHGAELLAPWMEEQIEQFKNGRGKDIYEAESYEEDEDDDEEKSDNPAHDSIYDSIDEALRAIDKLVEAVQALKPAERTDLGRYSYRHPARGTRCNCDAADDSDDRPP